MAETKKLFDQFAPVTPEEWRAKAEVDLKGADFEKKMVWRTNEGFSAQPLYRSVDIADLKQTKSLPGEFPYVRGTRHNNDWKVRQNIDVDDVQAANAKALEVLDKGINSIGFHLHNGDVDLKALLKGIVLPACEINLQCCPKCALKYAKELVELCKEAGCVDTFVGSIAFNPFKRTFKHGEPFPGDIVAMATELMNTVKPVAHLRVLSVDSLALNNAGAYIYQELGYALAWGAEWMAMLTEAGFTADEVANRIKFNMGVSTVYFMEIAKFRAARLLWAKIVREYEPICNCGESCKCEKVDGKYCPCAMKMHVCATTSTFNMTIFDAYVNLLRSQTEAMSAAIAGVDSMVVTPFDVTYKQPDDFSERIARNQQLLLAEESHFDKVIDPAAGSYYLENLTAMIADEAWKRFLAIQDNGGFLAQVLAGKVQADMQDNLTKRLGDVAKRKETLLGTNQFPNFNEQALDKIQETGHCCHCCGQDAAELPILPCVREAEQFEALRLRTEQSGKQPKVFMLTIGNLAMRLARSQFSCNFFACAGYKVIDNNGFKTVEEGVDAGLKAGADIIVLCSSDDEYAEFAPAAYKYLADRAIFVVAGAPACMEDLQKAGIENYIHVRVNVLDELTKYSNKLLK